MGNRAGTRYICLFCDSATSGDTSRFQGFSLQNIPSITMPD
ncbi:hypothetical protein M8C21_027685 [Ambrosia artemisiifolia]|uniref:Uncharacterized protein n=1 Tax=Ambrosia artemisiifolia TaxID=4212 RepID=A0AAD5D9N9_AMBAR|nr:hypothetical protein M8C21_027685 [Ambrosia artemisiifolia]